MTRRALFQATAGLIALALCTEAGLASPLFENSGFELGTFKNWSVEGMAFEGGPTEKGIVPEADGTGSIEKRLDQNWGRHPHLYNQPELAGCDNKVFANSFHPGILNRAKGSLTSVPFVIGNDYITFQLAGGNPACDGIFAVNLLVGEQVVRQALPTGDKFTRCTFDVRALKGNSIDCSYVEMKLSFGHDAFLLENRGLNRMVRSFIDTTARRQGISLAD